LTEDGRRLVGEEFMRGETEISRYELEPFLEEIERAPRVDFAHLDEVVDEVVDTYSPFETAMDVELVAEVHSTVDVTRRTAAIPGLWHWLAIERYPHFVRHRWKYRSETSMREKFLGAGSDLYSNAIHRYWWIAELTHDEQTDDYSLTESVFESQTLVNKVFDRWFARYEPAVVAVCDVLKDEPGWLIEDATNQFNHALTSVQLESMSRSEAEDTIREIVEEVRGSS
jgi:hypothetical protein